MINKTKLQNLLKTVQGKVNSQEKTKKKETAEELNLGLNLNNNELDSKQDWGGMVSIHKDNENNSNENKPATAAATDASASASSLKALLAKLKKNKTQNTNPTPTSTTEPTVNPTPVNPTPVNPTPVDPTPVNPTPVDPTPVDPTPVNPTPINNDYEEVTIQGDYGTYTIVRTYTNPKDGVTKTETRYNSIDEIAERTTYFSNGKYLVESMLTNNNGKKLYDKDGNMLISAPSNAELVSCDGESMVVKYNDVEYELTTGDRLFIGMQATTLDGSVCDLNVALRNDIERTLKLYNGADGTLSKTINNVPIEGELGSIEWAGGSGTVFYDEQGRVIRVLYNAGSYSEIGQRIEYSENGAIKYPEGYLFPMHGRINVNEIKFYDNSGSYIGGIDESLISGEGVIVKNDDGTTTIRVNGSDGSYVEKNYDITKMLAKPNGEIPNYYSGGYFLISEEGKITISDLGTKVIRGIKIKNYNDEPTEVTYSWNADSGMEINANNVVMDMTYATLEGWLGSITYAADSISDGQEYQGYHIFAINNWGKLTVKGDNNEIIGTGTDDDVKVIGNNNQIDLAAGEDKLIVIGENNSVKNTEDVTMRSKDIPAGELGSMEYVLNLLDVGLPSLNETFEIAEKDDEGRVTKFNLINSMSILRVRGTYNISYNANGEISQISVELITGTGGKTEIYNAEGKLISKEEISYLSEGGTKIIQTAYEEYCTIQTTTVNNSNGKPISIEKNIEYEAGDSILFKDEFTYYENGEIKTSVRVENENGIQLQKVTTNYNDEGIMTSQNGEVTLRERETKTLGSVRICNANENSQSYTYSIDSENKLTINCNELYISPANYYIWGGPIVIFDYALGKTVEIDNQDTLNSIVESNKSYVNSEFSFIRWQNEMTNITINGNKNTIEGSYNDDEITVQGNNNTIDLEEGEDKLKIAGYNNIIKNVEEIN